MNTEGKIVKYIMCMNNKMQNVKLWLLIKIYKQIKTVANK